MKQAECICLILDELASFDAGYTGRSVKVLRISLHSSIATLKLNEYQAEATKLNVQCKSVTFKIPALLSLSVFRRLLLCRQPKAR